MKLADINKLGCNSNPKPTLNPKLALYAHSVSLHTRESYCMAALHSKL